jgi:LacI family transcriptional regulator
VRIVYDKVHKKIAMIHGGDNFIAKLRTESFHKICRELGLAIPAEYVRQAQFHNPDASALATRELLALTDRPTCIMYPDDFSFCGGMTEIENAGLSIPNDISVVGFDGIYLSKVFRPKLTTIKQNTERLGSEAAKLLVEALNDTKDYTPRHILYGNTVRRRFGWTALIKRKFVRSSVFVNSPH